ncbi:MAG: hypothetical protein RJA35_702 [Actinomycetota bacterium]|jgi:hypothetical protein
MKHRAPKPKPKDVGLRVEVRNANSPGWTGKVDAAKFEATSAVLMRILPRQAPGMTQTEIKNKAVFHLPQHLFPGGDNAAWWVKCVLLDLEADGIVEREKSARPLRWHKA